MKFVMVCEGLVGIALTGDSSRVPTGLFLESFNADAHQGRGAATWTSDIERALQFDSPSDGFAIWKRQSTVKPTRPDGHPNRPLTAFSVSFLQV